MSDLVHVWMIQSQDQMDEGRIAMQTEAPRDEALPWGVSAGDWEVRETDVPAEDWQRLLSGEMTPDEQDTFHREAWSTDD